MGEPLAERSGRERVNTTTSICISNFPQGEAIRSPAVRFRFSRPQSERIEARS